MPVPGGPCSTAPFGIFAPSASYIWGFFRKFTNSMISTLASSQPATSLKVVVISVSGPIFLAVLRPNPIMPPRPPPPPIPPIEDIDDANRCVIQMRTPTIKSVGANFMISFVADVSDTYLRRRQEESTESDDSSDSELGVRTHAIGIRSCCAMFKSRCAFSIFRSKLSTEPIVKNKCSSSGPTKTLRVG